MPTTAPATQPDPSPATLGTPPPASSQPEIKQAPAAPKAIPVVVTAQAKYDGGSLLLDSDEKVRVTVKDRILSIAQTGGEKAVFKVPIEQIAEIVYSNRSRSRTAEAIGVGAVNPTAGVLLGNVRTTQHYVQIVWEGQEPGGVSLKVGKDDYRGLLAGLEASTGLRARVITDPPVRDW